jgi:hypothetical protein
MNSSMVRRRSVKRRAAAEAETKIKKLSKDDETYDSYTKGEAAAAATPSQGKNSAFTRSNQNQDRKRKGSIATLPLSPHRKPSPHASATTTNRHPNQSFASSIMSSSSLSSFSSSLSSVIADESCTVSCSGVEPEDGRSRGASDDLECAKGEVSVHAGSRKVQDEAFGIDSVMKERIAHQRRRAKRQINSSGTMHLSRRSHHRIQKDQKRNPDDSGDELSPIVARTLELTPVANIPTTPAAHYRLNSATTTEDEVLQPAQHYSPHRQC